jgi:hypothetical protein
MEAEYIACFFLAIQDIVWIRRPTGCVLKDPTRVHIDNKSARQLAENPVHQHHQSTLASSITGSAT